ncbi:MAG: hypothetical protein QOF16_563 [Actinomycetota bacterium]|nr:hypothetical protein [Actinomycetota bacterium]
MDINDRDGKGMNDHRGPGIEDAAPHVSELLRDYVQGGLTPAIAEDVREHLDRCEECRLELVAVTALGSTGADPLTEIESARLTDVVKRRTHPATRRDRHWGSIAAGLGAAAVVALGVVLSLHLGAGDSANSSTNAGGASTTRSVSHDQVAAEPSPASGAEAAAPRPTPLFEHHPAVTVAQLRSEGSNGTVFKAFAGYFDSADAARLRPVLTKQLADQAPSTDLSSQIERCTQAVVTSENHPTLPAYAAATSFRNHPALVLGFAWTPALSGPLDHYMFWAWARRGCGFPLTYETGQVKP